MSNEQQTRKEIIDTRLQQAGWNVADRTQVVEEFFVPATNALEESPAAYGIAYNTFAGDFRQGEENFRELDSKTRQTIIKS